jgi:hypothetical protein
MTTTWNGGTWTRTQRIDPQAGFDFDNAKDRPANESRHGAQLHGRARLPQMRRMKWGEDFGDSAQEGKQSSVGNGC